jgi:hypothetical protein
MAFAALAILGHRSAHSFPAGPVIADPFISPFGFAITPALSSKYMKTPSFRRLWLTLPHNDCRQNLLPEIRLPFLDSCHHHVTNACRWQPVEATLNSFHRDNVQVLRPCYQHSSLSLPLADPVTS